LVVAAARYTGTVQRLTEITKPPCVATAANARINLAELGSIAGFAGIGLLKGLARENSRVSGERAPRSSGALCPLAGAAR
jgi:hypothetical protein